MSPEASPIQQAFNLAVFGPLGIALAAKDALPEWIDKGRARAVEQFAMARAVGEMVTDYGQQKVTEKLVGLGILPGPQPPVPSRAPGAEPSLAVAEPAPAVAEPASTNGRSSSASGGRRSATSRRRGSATSGGPGPVAPAAGVPVVDRDDLAIPGYDSLSASQVVSRLAGLAPDELEAVRAYEATSRGRRTILTKISQLQTGWL